MNGTEILLDLGPPGGAVGAFAGIAFFLVLVATAFLVFRLLRKTLSIVFRILIVLIILGVAFMGTAAWFFLGSGGSGPRRPPIDRPR